MTTKPLEDEETPSKAEVAPGEVLGGKFRVERVVGRGGMGVVVEATNLQLDQKVALKLLATKRDDPASVERFNSEAKAAARLRSEHVARVFDVGKDTLHGPFIVMEMLEGKTLADVISSSGRVAPHRAVEYVIDACEGLAEAHARGIIHQDVKPANLFLVTGPDGRPSVKLLDFGIATIRSKERDAIDPKSSHPSLGTPAYLAPEQLRNTGNLTHRADVWALGCVLYELLVGDRPFRAKRFTELVTKILETAPEPIPADLQLPEPLVAAILRCLERDPEKRFASSAGLAVALMPYARPRAHLAVTRAVGHATKSGLEPDLRVPDSTPPDAIPPSSPDVDFPRSDQLRAPALPKFSTGPVAKADMATLSPAAEPAAAAQTEKKAPIAILALVGVALLVVAGILLFHRSEGDAPSGAPTASASAPAPPAEKASGSPPATATTAVTAEPAPSASASPRLVTPPTIPVRPAGVAPPKPNKPAPSTKPSSGGESEIRFQR